MNAIGCGMMLKWLFSLSSLHSGSFTRLSHTSDLDVGTPMALKGQC